MTLSIRFSPTTVYVRISIGAPLVDRLKYSPEDVSNDEMLDCAEELEALRDVLETNDIDPDNITHSLEAIEAARMDKQSKLEAHESFLEDCVQSLDGAWPTGADINDQHLLTVITDTMAEGVDFFDDCRDALDLDLGCTLSREEIQALIVEAIRAGVRQ